MRFVIAIVLLTGVAYADDTWKITNTDHTNMKLPDKYCGTDIQLWINSIVEQHPKLTITHGLITLELGKKTTLSDRALVTPDYAIGFWDEPPWSDQGATLIARLHPKPGKVADVEMILIQRHSVTDRGDACYIEWQGKAER